MRKSGYIFLGLLLMVGAIGTASWRHVIEPSRSLSRTTSFDRISPAARSERPATRSFSQEQTRTQTRLSTWDTVDLLLNALNAVVGIIGIWLAIAGMRMQRAAAHAQAQAIQIAGRDR